jgi:hypothetical protein
MLPLLWGTFHPHRTNSQHSLPPRCHPHRTPNLILPPRLSNPRLTLPSRSLYYQYHRNRTWLRLPHPNLRPTPQRHRHLSPRRRRLRLRLHHPPLDRPPRPPPNIRQLLRNLVHARLLHRIIHRLAHSPSIHIPKPAFRASRVAETMGHVILLRDLWVYNAVYDDGWIEP